MFLRVPRRHPAFRGNGRIRRDGENSRRERCTLLTTAFRRVPTRNGRDDRKRTDRTPILPIGNSGLPRLYAIPIITAFRFVPLQERRTAPIPRDRERGTLPGNVRVRPIRRQDSSPVAPIRRGRRRGCTPLITALRRVPAGERRSVTTPADLRNSRAGMTTPRPARTDAAHPNNGESGERRTRETRKDTTAFPFSTARRGNEIPPRVRIRDAGKAPSRRREGITTPNGVPFRRDAKTQRPKPLRVTGKKRLAAECRRMDARKRRPRPKRTNARCLTFSALAAGNASNAITNDKGDDGYGRQQPGAFRISKGV